VVAVRCRDCERTVEPPTVVCPVCVAKLAAGPFQDEPVSYETQTSHPALTTKSLANIQAPDAERITSKKTLPLWAGMFHGLVGASETGKTTLAAEAARDTAEHGMAVLILDGEMSAAAWRRKLEHLGADNDTLARIHYAEMTDDCADVDKIRATIAKLVLRLIVWDSALSLISRTARSETTTPKSAG
jgi:predicted ATP-dependent serine protease